MPRAAGRRCVLKPDHTPCAPQSTSHKCRVYRGYLHGTCGVPDPLDGDTTNDDNNINNNINNNDNNDNNDNNNSETRRICHACVVGPITATTAATTRKATSTTSASSAAGASKRHRAGDGNRRSTGNKKKKETTVAADATSINRSSKPAGSKAALPRKARGADDRVRLTYKEKAQALDLLESMTGTAVAAKLGIGVSTLYKWKREGEGIRKTAEAAAKPGSKSTKGVDFPEVEAEVLNLYQQARALELPIQRLTIQAFGRKACASLLRRTSSTDAQRERYSGFVASLGWAKKFVTRNNLKLKPARVETSSTFHGEETNTDGLNNTPDMRHKNAEAGPALAQHCGASAGGNNGGGPSSTQSAALPCPPPFADVASDFDYLEGVAERCSMPEVWYYLRKAKLAWMSDFGLRKKPN